MAVRRIYYISIRLDVRDARVLEPSLGPRRQDAGLAMGRAPLFLRLGLRLFMSYVRIAKDLARISRSNVRIVLERELYRQTLI